MKVTRIRIPAMFSLAEDGLMKNAVADFALGEGPCGKTVVELSVECREGVFEVSQVTEDGEAKVFLYPLSLMTGRVEVTYGAA